MEAPTSYQQEQSVLFRSTLGGSGQIRDRDAFSTTIERHTAP